jgi:AcrR family transcriptional regulator
MAGSTQDPSPAHVDPTDVRVRRTWARLSEAVLRLAAERPVEQVAVSDLVRAAGINRSTFYKHAASPADVLERVLYADLDRLRAHWIAEAAGGRRTPEAWHRVVSELAEHVLRHEAVYTAGLVGQRSPVLQRLLVDHLSASVRAFVDRSPQALPAGAGSVAWRAEAWSSFLAHGQVGVMEAWLSLPGERDVALFAGAVEAVLPAWITPGLD